MTDARILDRGYRKFAGQRSGVPGAVRSVTWHTIRSILGLGRSGRHKVFPIIVAVIALVPATVFLAVAVLFADFGDEIRPEYWEFFGFSIMAALLFTAFVAPEGVVRDRRDGMFSLYMSTPLTKPTYLLAKMLAVTSTLWLIVGLPVVMVFVGYTAQGMGPDGFPAWLGVAGRLLAAGLLVSAIYTAVSLGASSLTDRRAFASVAVILLMFGLSVALGLMVNTGGMDQHLRLLDPLTTPMELPARLFGGRSTELDRVATTPVVGANVAWFLVAIGAIVARYRKLAAV